MKRILLTFFILSLVLNTLPAQIVTTQFGQIQGSMDGAIHKFLGIPFAKPPVDSLRWKAPQNPEAWANVLNTTAFAPVCPQNNYTQGDTVGTPTGNEDCLYLNIWTPQTGAGTRPVLVFIHGGGNQQGGAGETSGGTSIYDGKNMAERGDAVIVTIQYRLGPLGFLVHPGLEAENANGKAGNYAALDQILALTWIQNNIANFGGDPSKVMIFGESAGGVNVGNLLTTPLAAGLFQRACIQSAAPVLGNYTSTKNNGIDYVDNYTTTGNDAQKIAFMRALPADSLVKDASSPLAGGVVQMNWQSVIDNVVFNQSALQTFQSGNFNKVPLIIGTNADEMSLNVPQVVTPAMVTAFVNSSIPAAYQAQVLALYPPGTTNTQAKQAYIGILTDGQFTTTARRTAQCVSANQTQPVWRYFFTHKHTLPQLANLGSYHGMELFYVFNNWENATGGTGPLFKPQDDSVQQAMLNYWINFANTGDPNGGGWPTWPQYQGNTDCHLEIKATPDGSQCGLRTAQSDLWDDIVNYTACSSTIGIGHLSENNIKVYPNPASNNFIIELPGKTFTLQVIDVTGKAVYSSYTERDKAIISCTTFSPGIYYLQLAEGTNTYKNKVVITR